MSIKVIKPRLEIALENAHSTLLHHIDETYVDPVEQIPRYIIEDCEAVIFLTEIKALDGSKASNGILMFHPSKNEWGAPCSIYLEDTHDIKGSSGLRLSEKDYVLFIQNSKTLYEFFKKGKLHIGNYGNKVHIMDGPLGRNTILEKNLSHDDKPLAGVLCYAISKKILSDKNAQINPKDHYKWLDNCQIVVSNIDNKEFYQNKINAADLDKLEIFENWYKNLIPIPNHDRYYYELVTKLNEYIDQPNKLKVLAQDKVQRLQEEITDKVVEGAKAEVKNEAKQELKNRIFGKDKTEKMKDNIEEQKMKDGHVNDTRDVRLLRGIVTRATKLFKDIWNAGETNEEEEKHIDKHEKGKEKYIQDKSHALPTMNNPDKVTVPITPDDIPMQGGNVENKNSSLQSDTSYHKISVPITSNDYPEINNDTGGYKSQVSSTMKSPDKVTIPVTKNDFSTTATTSNNAIGHQSSGLQTATPYHKVTGPTTSNDIPMVTNDDVGNKSQKSTTMKDPNKVTVPMTEKDKIVHPSNENYIQRDA